MTDPIRFRIEGKGHELALSADPEGSCPPQVLVFMEHLGNGDTVAIAPKIANAQGGGGIADYCAYHFESEPDLWVVVPDGYVQLSNYFGSANIPRGYRFQVVCGDTGLGRVGIVEARPGLRVSSSDSTQS